MYTLPYFTEEDDEKVLAFMQENSFAIITGMNKEYPVATHVPLDIKELEGKIIFTGHMMKNTDHHKAFVQNNNVLVIFNGPHCYISASWYAKADVASTWNYITAHAKGKINFTDEAGTIKIIEGITNKYEPPDSAAAFKKLPSEYVNKLVKAIVGFTIEVESLENVFKLSQNHEIETQRSIISHLENNGGENERAIADEMKQRAEISKQST